MLLTFLPIVIVIVLLAVVAALGYIDRKKRRSLAALPPLSFMIPCYNDVDSVGQTVKSVFEVLGPDTDVIVIDDCSSDGSRQKLTALKAVHRFRLFLNRSNLGKSRTLNEHFRLARNDIVVFVDADVIVSRKPLEDAVARLQDSRVGAVSCPYKSANAGFIPLMQNIEYNMLAFVQGAYNVFSAIALWGGFIAVKRDAFKRVGGFSPNAITEDMDLAFKLNQSGMRVEQSFEPISTYVPATFRQLFKQKIRWSSGGLQCFVKYHRVWLKNPLHVCFMLAVSILFTFSALKLGKDIRLWNEVSDYFVWLNHSGTFWPSLRLTCVKFGVPILRELFWRIGFTLLSLPFVLPLVSTFKQAYLCFMIIPFSIFYVPLFSMVSLFGAICFIRKRRLLRTAARAW